MQTMIDLLAPLSVAQTAAVALGIVTAVIISPGIIIDTVVGIVRRVREIARTCTDREAFDPDWMDAEAVDHMGD